MADVTSPAERGVLTATNDLLVAGCAAIASLSAGGILSGAGYWAVGGIFGTLMIFAVPGLLRLQEPEVGVYVERPKSALGGHTGLSSRLRRDALDEALYGFRVGGDALEALGSLEEVGERRRQRRRDAGRALDCVRELGRVRGRQRDERRCRGAPVRARPAASPTRRVRVEQRAAPAVFAAHRPRASRVVERRGLEELAEGGQRRWLEDERAGPREAGELALGALGIASVELEEQALEVRRDLDVHARAERRHDVAGLHAAAREQARQDVVGVGADHEALQRQADRRARPSPRARCRSCPWAPRTRGRGRRARPSPRRSTAPEPPRAPS